ncbi:hypothetical protein HDU98_003696, partial [Podochytrium sp. JEL0797]
MICTLPKLVLLGLLGAGVVIAALDPLSLVWRRRRPKKAARDWTSLFALAGQRGSDVAAASALYVAARASDPRDAFGRSVFCHGVLCFHFAFVRAVLGLEQSDKVLFATDAEGLAVVHALVANASKHSLKDTQEMLKLILASNTRRCLQVGKSKTVYTKQTPLMLAVTRATLFPEALEIATLLVKLHADLDAQDAHGRTALMLACMHKDTQHVALWLLSLSSCDFQCLDLGHKSALWYAAASGQSESVNRMIRKKRNAEATLLKSMPSNASLASVASSNASSAVSGLNSKRHPHLGSSASLRQREEKVVIDPFTQPNALDQLTPFLVSVRNGFLEIAQSLWDVTTTTHAAMAGGVGNYGTLTTTTTTANGTTALHLAVQSGRLEMVRFVMESKICDDFTVPDDSGITAFHLASQLHHPDLLTHFLAISTTTNPHRLLTRAAQTPLHLACMASTTTSTSPSGIARLCETVRVLVQSGSRDVVSWRDEEGRTPLVVFLGGWANGDEREDGDEETRRGVMEREEVVRLLTPGPTDKKDEGGRERGEGKRKGCIEST